ncbi:MAG: hypothetical protein CSB34_01265 [Desulfobulbus propionicus]|nr:MAG: hypothetical protein CSB34_01265 [Desulfobulbus propionicus]
MKQYDAYLFDADGTLFDTVELIYTCFTYVARKYIGSAIDRATVINGIGLPLQDQLITHLGEEHDIQQLLSDYLNYQLSVIDDGIQLFPGVMRTLEHLKKGNKKLAIVTSRRRISLERLLNATNTAQYFDVVVSPEDTDKHKPDPEPVLKAMSLLSTPPSRTVFIGDAKYDICSGASAGIDTVFVGWSHIQVDTLPVTPTWVIDSFDELLLR